MENKLTGAEYALLHDCVNNSFKKWMELNDYEPITNATALNIAAEAAESYHAERLKEVAGGDCFTEAEINYKMRGVGSEQPYFFELTSYLNTRAAEWAAAKTKEMFTEEQMLAALRLARKGYDGGQSFDLEDLFGSTELETIGMEYMYSEDDIINQIKQK